MLTSVHFQQFIGPFQVSGRGVNITNGDSVFTVYNSLSNTSGPSGFRVVETTFDSATNSYQTTARDFLAENQVHDGVALGPVASVSTGEEMLTFQIGGATKVVSSDGNTVRIFELDTTTGTLTLESSESLVLGDSANTALAVSVEEDQSGFSLSGNSPLGTSTILNTVRFNADGVRTGPIVQQSTTDPSLRAGTAVNAEVDDGAGGVRNFNIVDHIRTADFTVSEIVNGAYQSVNVQTTGSAGGPGDRFAIAGTSVRVPQSSGGPDRTFVYFDKPVVVSRYEVDINGNLTFLGDLPKANSADSGQTTTFFTDGGGEVYALTGGTAYSVNDNGSFTQIADLNGAFAPFVGDYDFAVLNNSLHIVLVERASSGIHFLNTNIPATPPILGPVPCFARGAMIDTDTGPRAIETLKVGDLVRTEDHGLQAIRWIGQTRVSRSGLRSNAKLVPIRIAAHALGPNVPSSDLIVSPQHRMVISSKIVERVTGEEEVLVPAVKLLGVEGVERMTDFESVQYFHLLLSGHEVIFANGAKTESLLIGPYLKNALKSEYVREIKTLFPEAFDVGQEPRSVRMIVQKSAMVRKIAERHDKNGRPLVQNADLELLAAFSRERRLEETLH